MPSASQQLCISIMSGGTSTKKRSRWPVTRRIILRQNIFRSTGGLIQTRTLRLVSLLFVACNTCVCGGWWDWLTYYRLGRLLGISGRGINLRGIVRGARNRQVGFFVVGICPGLCILTLLRITDNHSLQQKWASLCSINQTTVVPRRRANF